MRRLQIFDAVARNLSVTAAAAELHLTQSAVSHQVRKLSEQLGEPLLLRRGRNIELTEAGRQLGTSLDSAFGLIEQASSAVVAPQREMVRLAIYSSFAQTLVKALPRFQTSHPTLDLRIVMLSDPHEISGRVADVFVTSEPVCFGYRSTLLFPERLVPVATGDPADWSRPMTLITAEVVPALAGRDWEAFADLNDLPLSRLQARPWLCCTHYVVAYEMMRIGMGTALLPEHMAQPILAAGMASRLPGKPLPTGLTYRIQVKHERSRETSILQVVDWLKGLARRYVRPVAELAEPVRRLPEATRPDRPPMS